MIQSAKVTHAQRAIHRLVLKARELTLENHGEASPVYALLDDIEYLLALLDESSDRTAVFSESLDGTASRFGGLSPQAIYLEVEAMIDQPVVTQTA